MQNVELPSRQFKKVTELLPGTKNLIKIKITEVINITNQSDYWTNDITKCDELSVQMVSRDLDERI